MFDLCLYKFNLHKYGFGITFRPTVAGIRQKRLNPFICRELHSCANGDPEQKKIR
jgi:hypothetical protein